jgi:hypothetical protein
VIVEEREEDADNKLISLSNKGEARQAQKNKNKKKGKWASTKY